MAVRPIGIIQAFSDAVQAIYDAALIPENWPLALSRIGSVFDAEGAVIIFYSGNEQADFIACDELREAVDIYQAEEWWKQDLHAQRAIQLHITHGDVFNDQTIATPEEIETHPIYIEFFRKVGFGWLMSCAILPELDKLVAVSVPRSKAKGSFDRDDMDLLGRLGRHVEQSLRISLRVASLNADEGAMRAAIDAIDAGIYVLGEEGRLLFGNACARAQVGNYFQLVSERMVTQSEDDQSRFSALLTAASQSDMQLPARPCVIAGIDGGELAVWAMPATNASRTRIGVREIERILLFAMPVERDHLIDPTVIRDIFALSLGEARLAALVGAGLETREAADRLGITEGTARIVLKRVFKKLGIHRQAQLVQRLSNLGHFSALHHASGSYFPGNLRG